MMSEYLFSHQAHLHNRQKGEAPHELQPTTCEDCKREQEKLCQQHRIPTSTLPQAGTLIPDLRRPG